MTEDTFLEKISQVNQIKENYGRILTQSEQQDLAQRLKNLETLLFQARELEKIAISSNQVDDSFLAQETLEQACDGLKQLITDLEIALNLGWTEVERQFYIDYTQEEIQELQQLMELWSSGTYFSIIESVTDHALRKGYGKDVLAYLGKAAGFDKTKAVRVPSIGYRDDGTARWENKNTGEYLIEDELGKIRTYGIN